MDRAAPTAMPPARITERPANTGQERDRPDVGPQIETLADREPEAPEADVVGDGGPADRAEVDRVGPAKLIEAIGGHHPAVLGVVVTAPGELAPPDAECAGTGGRRLHHRFPHRNDLAADSVTGYDGDRQFRH